MTAALQHELIWSVLPRRYLAVVECTMPPGEHPCTQVRCRYHLAQIGVGEHRTQTTRDCALKVACEGPRTLDEVGEVRHEFGRQLCGVLRYAEFEQRLHPISVICCVQETA